jgi:hypothetical protein
VHPAADVFPLMSKAELRELADDIDRNGLKEGVTLYTDPATYESELLDGRNRLDALQLLGEPMFTTGGRLRESLCRTRLPSDGAVDPAAYVISKNIHRRHLTKRQQADLIVAAVKAADTDRAKAARSVTRDRKTGRVQGTTKDPVKTRVVAEAAKHGIGARTAGQALVDAEPERKRPQPSPSTTEAVPMAGVRSGKPKPIDSKARTVRAKAELDEALKPLRRYLKWWTPDRLYMIGPPEARQLLKVMQEVDRALLGVKRALEERTITSRALR